MISAREATANSRKANGENPLVGRYLDIIDDAIRTASFSGLNSISWNVFNVDPSFSSLTIPARCSILDEVSKVLTQNGFTVSYDPDFYSPHLVVVWPL